MTSSVATYLSSSATIAIVENATSRNATLVCQSCLVRNWPKVQGTRKAEINAEENRQEKVAVFGQADILFAIRSILTA
jgi:hypothetical protein